MALFTEHYLVIDYGSTYIKGVLYQTGPGGDKILRLESLPIVSLEDIPVIENVGPVIIDETGADPQAGTDNKEKDLLGVNEESAGAVVAEQSNLAQLGEYEYNLVRYVQSFFPEVSNYIINIPLEKIFVRDLSVPVTNARQVDEVVPFEVENVLPVSLEETEVLGRAWQINEESSSVVSFSIEHKHLTEAVEPLRRSDSSIKMLSVDAAGLSGFMNLLPDEESENRVVAQVDIGGLYTIINVIKNRRLVYTRKIPVGGQDITDLIAREFKLDPEEAETKKLAMDLDLGLLLALKAERPDNYLTRHRTNKTQFKRILKETTVIMDTLIAEVERSILSLPCEPPECFYLSGGVALMGGVRDYLETKLHRRVQDYPTHLSNGGPVAIWANALGTMGHYRLKNDQKIDFLQTPFGNMLKGGQLNFNMFSTPIMVLTSAAIVFLLSLFVSIYMDQQQIKAGKYSLVSVVSKIPGMNAKKSDNNPKKIITQLRNLCRMRLGAQAGDDSSNVLGVLYSLHELTPAQDALNFKFKSFTFDGKIVSIDASVGNYQDQVAFVDALKKSGKFKKVKTTRSVPEYNRTAIALTIQLELKRGAGFSSATCK